MLLLKRESEHEYTSEVWTARSTLRAAPCQVLDALTNPQLIAEWAPVPFEVDGLPGDRLTTGSRARVSGSLAGVRATFEVEVIRADARRLEIVADGPLAFDVAYTLCERERGVLVEASIGLRRRRGLSAQLVRAAVAALLSAGALNAALARLESALAAGVAEPGLAAAA
jgi:Polyketide cyclase / dehydrase and lipid transport